MITNNAYWEQRRENAWKAAEHTAAMEAYPIGISRIYQSEECEALGGNGTVTEYLPDPEPGALFPHVENMDTVTALFEMHRYVSGQNICVLNFASYKNPGGAFLKGSKAQEESLCHESNLYNVLSGQEEYYAFNRRHLNRGLYMDRAIFSKDVVFIRDGATVKADVLTCAAPNRDAGMKHGRVTPEENARALKKRIRFICSVMQKEGVRTAILGAFGCGVFKQDAYEVAELFSKETVVCGLSAVSYAVPAKPHRENYDAFLKAIQQ